MYDKVVLGGNYLHLFCTPFWYSHLAASKVCTESWKCYGYICFVFVDLYL